MSPEDLTTEELLEVAGERLMSIPEAARLLDAEDPDGNWYPVRVHREIEEGRLSAVRVGGDKTEGFNLVDRRQVLELLED